VAREAGFRDAAGVGVRAIRCARGLFPASAAVREASLYARHNRARDGPLVEGGVASAAGSVALTALPFGLGLAGADTVPPSVLAALPTASLREHARRAAAASA
jgi:hypothetical protein